MQGVVEMKRSLCWEITKKVGGLEQFFVLWGIPEWGSDHFKDDLTQARELSHSLSNQV